MSVSRNCRECGVLVPTDAPFGHCPGCLVELGFAAPPFEAADTKANALGDYQLLEIIGRGGMGVVYRARQVSLNRLVALKMLNPQSAAFPNVAERLGIEAEAAASLHHPGIVTIHEVGVHAGQPFFTMELVEGAGLDRFISKTGYLHPKAARVEGPKARGPEASSVRTMVSIARAVDYAHKRGVLHRDLKPANIVIDTAGEPHLTDFGLAKIMGRERARETDSGSVLGTPAYMSPEQAAGETKRVSTAADIYSLGAVLYEMLTGQPPFHGDTPLDTLRLVTEAEPKSPQALNPAVDTDLATICLTCLNKDPEHRYDTAQSLADDLERWLRGEPIEARPVGQLERFWRWCRREPRMASMAAGLLALLAATTVLVLSMYQREKELRETEQQQAAQDRSALFNRIEKEWNADNGSGVRIYAREIALLSKRPFKLEGNEQTFVLGIHALRLDANPLSMVQRLASVVNRLTLNLQNRGGMPCVFELHLYTTYSNALSGFREGQVQLMPLSPASYLDLRRTHAVTPLVRHQTGGEPGLRIAMISRADSPAREPIDAKGRSMVFGPVGFLVEDWVKADLWSLGLRASDFSVVTNLPQAWVISAVNARRFDIGLADFIEVTRQMEAGVPLRVLRVIRTPGYVWTASGGLNSKEATSIRDALIAINDRKILELIDDELTGFQAVAPTDFDEVERIVRQARQFDGKKN